MVLLAEAVEYHQHHLAASEAPCRCVEAILLCSLLKTNYLSRINVIPAIIDSLNLATQPKNITNHHHHQVPFFPEDSLHEGHGADRAPGTPVPGQPRLAGSRGYESWSSIVMQCSLSYLCSLSMSSFPSKTNSLGFPCSTRT